MGIFGILIAIFAAFLVCKIVETVYVRISKSNLGTLIRQALNHSKEEKARKILAKAIKGTVKGKTPNTVSIDIFDDSGNTAVELTLKSSQGVDASIIPGMAV